MFGRIAPTYDGLNRALSLGTDVLWRRAAIRCLAPRSGEHIADICCGTGDLALAAQRSGCTVTGADFTEPMLVRALAKSRRRGQAVSFAAGDALALPWRDRSFQGAVMGFGLRNLADPVEGLSEAGRVLQEGGRFVVLEFSRPSSRLVRSTFDIYFRHVLPRVGRWVSRDDAYQYLVDTVMGFPSPAEVEDWFRQAGFAHVERRLLSGGIACLHRGVVGGSGEAAG